MRNIYYLGNQANIDVNTPIPIEVELSSLGESKLTITKFTGEFVQSVKLSGVEILVNEGDVLEIDKEDVITATLTLKLNDIESLPTYVYIETKELGDTTSVLVFRGGIEQQAFILPQIINILEEEVILNSFYVETNKTEDTNKEIGLFTVQNIGSAPLSISNVEFIENYNNNLIIKDYISFRDSTTGLTSATLQAGESTSFFIDVDTRSSGAGSPTYKFLDNFDFDETFEESLLKREGFIRVTSDDRGNANTKTEIPISGNAYAPILAYEVVDTLLEQRGVSDLIFNYEYNKVNTKDLKNNLRLYNYGNMDLIISDISSNYSITSTGITSYPITSSETSDITISPGNFYDFNIEFVDIQRADKLNDDGSPNTSEYEDFKKIIERDLLIRSNAINYSEITDADYGVSFLTNNALNKRMFKSSIWYEDTIYSWYPIERNYFAPGILEPGGLNSQKLQIWNGLSTNLEEVFKVEIVYYGEEVGTTAWLENISYN